MYFPLKDSSSFPLSNLEICQNHHFYQISIYSGKYVNYTISNYLCFHLISCQQTSLLLKGKENLDQMK